jgi:hypothetical protein
MTQGLPHRKRLVGEWVTLRWFWLYSVRGQAEIDYVKKFNERDKSN